MRTDNLLNERWKTKVHAAQIILITLAIFLSIGRVTIKNPPASRANTVAITMVRSTQTSTNRLSTIYTRSPVY